jgi:hypothetical protein
LANTLPNQKRVNTHVTSGTTETILSPHVCFTSSRGGTLENTDAFNDAVEEKKELDKKGIAYAFLISI